MNRTFAIAAALTLAISATAPAFAEAEDTAQTARFSYADLNLNTESGARAMLHRINRAARTACGDAIAEMNFSQRIGMRACVRETTAQVVADLNHPMVTAIHEGRTPAPLMLAQH